MTGVTHIQVLANLHFDDGTPQGFTVTLSTPLWHKDIRTGDFFSKEMTEQIIASAGQGLAGIVDHEGLEQIYHNVKRQFEKSQTPRKPHTQPGYGDDFSAN